MARTIAKSSRLWSAAALVALSATTFPNVAGSGVSSTNASATEPADDAPQTSWRIFAERVYPRPGETLENCLVLVQNGKVTAIAPGRSAEGDGILSVASLTAGMVDANANIHTGFASVEQSEEVQAHRRIDDAIDVFDYRWMRQAKSGVTTTIASAFDRNVIGGVSVALKTAGEESLEARTVKADVSLRGAMGSLPSSGNTAFGAPPRNFYQRRPTTRMGVEWEWRKAFFDAGQAGNDPARAFDGLAELSAVLAGKLPLCVQAWATQDVRTAVFLAEEMKAEGLGDIRLIVDSAAEAWKEPELLLRSKASVVLPPFTSRGRTLDGAFMPWNAAKTLVDMGVPVALSSHGARTAGYRLANQAGFAMRGGLSFDEALAAVTTNPAAMFGIDDRVGSIQVGRAADLVLWNGTPFESTSRVIGVLVDGNLVLDPR